MAREGIYKARLIVALHKAVSANLIACEVSGLRVKINGHFSHVNLSNQPSKLEDLATESCQALVYGCA